MKKSKENKQINGVVYSDTGGGSKKKLIKKKNKEEKEKDKKRQKNGKDEILKTANIGYT